MLKNKVLHTAAAVLLDELLHTVAEVLLAEPSVLSQTMAAPGQGAHSEWLRVWVACIVSTGDH